MYESVELVEGSIEESIESSDKAEKKSFEIYPQNSIGFATKIQSFDLFTCAYVCFEVHIFITTLQINMSYMRTYPCCSNRLNEK